MSLNVSILVPSYIIANTDRRLTTPDGSIVTERSNKLTYFECPDARGFITYNGIGLDQYGMSPSDWIAEIYGEGLTLQGLVARLQEIAGRKVIALPAVYTDRRHSFVISAFLYPAGIARLILVSNYEYLAREDADFEAASAFRVEAGGLRHLRSKAIFVTGATPVVRRKWINIIGAKIDRGLSPEKVRGAATKLIRNAAYAKFRRGTVGTSVSSGILMRDGRGTFDVNVVGGSNLTEGINVLTPGFALRDFVAYGADVRSDFLPFDKKRNRAIIPEPPCANCGRPIPLGYRQCPTCDQPARA